MFPFIEGLGSTREKTTVQMDDDVIVIQRRAEDLLREVNTGVKELQQRHACNNQHFWQNSFLCFEVIFGIRD